MAEAGVEFCVLHLRLGDRLLPGGHRQGPRAGPQGAEADHRHARARQPQRRARLRRGQRQAGRDGGPRRLRHAALRRRGAHGLARRASGADHRRAAAGGVPGSMLGAREPEGPSLAATDVRPERHRAAIHQVGPSSRISGQSRTDGVARLAGRLHRAARAGLSQHSARGLAREDHERALSDARSARRGAAAGARRGRHSRAGGPAGARRTIRSSWSRARAAIRPRSRRWCGSAN